MYAITLDRYGPPSVLRATDAARPSAGPGELLVEVHASAVSQGDRRLRAGDFPGITWLPGRLIIGLLGPRSPIPGTMFAGKVVAVGAGVTRLAVGDEVFGSAAHGAHAELLVVSEGSAVARMPDGLSYEQAAALPYGGLTALFFLRDLGGLQPGQRVCVLGATGGVGSVAVQLARAMGAEVTAVCSARNQETARALGASHTVDYRREDYRQRGPYDLIFDTIGATDFGAARAALSAQGRYLSLIMSAKLLMWTVLSRILGGNRAYTGVAPGGPAPMEQLAALASSGAIRPVIDRVFPLSAVADAHARVEAGGAPGMVVLRVGAAA